MKRLLINIKIAYLRWLAHATDHPFAYAAGVFLAVMPWIVAL